MKFENTKVFNFEGAFRGMRNPLNSWDKSDSEFDCFKVFCKDCVNKDMNVCCHNAVHIGKKDMELAQKLIRAGSEHRKFMRQILVSVEITAPLYYWKQFDTYKVGTTANSTSTMHKLATTPITLDCFEGIGFLPAQLHGLDVYRIFRNTIEGLEKLRLIYLETKDIRAWRALIKFLPESWLQKRTVTMNYENIFNMYHQRKNHKLKEWAVDFCDWVKTLPYAKKLIIGDETNEQG